jgi:hypothetical protein
MATLPPEDDEEDRFAVDDDQEPDDLGDLVIIDDEYGPAMAPVPAAYRPAEVEEEEAEDSDRAFIEREALRRDRLREAREKLGTMRQQTPTMLIVLGVVVALLFGLLLVFSGLLSSRSEEVVIADATELAPKIRGTHEEEDRFMIEIRNTEHRLEEINQRFRAAEITFDKVEAGLERMGYNLDDQLKNMISKHKNRLDKLLATITDFIVAEGYREAGLVRAGRTEDQR